MTILERLQAGVPIHEPVAVVVAHYDDETLGLGGSLHLFQNLTLIHVTDGGHPDPRAWVRAGLLTREAYVERREQEIAAAIRLGGWQITRHVTLGVPDQSVIRLVRKVETRLRAALDGAATVFTHPYEGGHPDHDALAFLVQRSGLPRYEFASYYLGAERRIAGRFWPHAAAPAITLSIVGEALARKRAALGAYASQGRVIEWFDPAIEQCRVAPEYDFRLPPPPPRCLYERKRFMRSDVWRRLAARAA